MDLRKARCIVLKDSDESIKNLHIESGPTIMIDCPPYSIYLIMTSTRETKVNQGILVTHQREYIFDTCNFSADMAAYYPRGSSQQWTIAQGTAIDQRRCSSARR